MASHHDAHAHHLDNGHTHDHHHHDDDTYYIDQLSLVGLSGAFGVICLCMYFWQTRMLEVMLAPQFFPFVLISGVILVTFALIRGAVLWFQVGQPGHTHHHHEHHHHHHGESCGHEHHHGEACSHDHHHHHEHAGCSHEHHHDASCSHGHAHGHEHQHGHHHHHDHDASDHDHGWAPWRYVVLMVPIALFLLGLPNKGPGVAAAAEAKPVDFTGEAMEYCRIVVAPDLTSRLTEVAVKFGQNQLNDPTPRDLKQLESYALSEQAREEWKGQAISYRGQFAPTRSDRVFNVARFKIGCCGADAQQFNVQVVYGESTANISIKPNEWLQVVGALDFQMQDGKQVPILRVPNGQYIKACNPEPGFYLQ